MCRHAAPVSRYRYQRISRRPAARDNGRHDAGSVPIIINNNTNKAGHCADTGGHWGPGDDNWRNLVNNSVIILSAAPGGMAGTLVSWPIIVIIWGQRCRANTQFLFLCALTQTDGCLATSQELIIDPFAKSSFLCWFFHLPPSEYNTIRLDVEDPGDTPDVRWLGW